MNPVNFKLCPLSALSDDERALLEKLMTEQKEKNCFDPAILSYPTLNVCVVSDDSGSFLFVPVQSVCMIESIASRDGTTPRKEAAALNLFDIGLNSVLKKAGIAERYFVCKDNELSDFCLKHGFEEMAGYRILRKRTT